MTTFENFMQVLKKQDPEGKFWKKIEHSDVPEILVFVETSEESEIVYYFDRNTGNLTDMGEC